MTLEEANLLVKHFPLDTLCETEKRRATLAQFLMFAYELGWAHGRLAREAAEERQQGAAPKAEREILGVVVAAYPRPVSLHDAAVQLGYSPASGGMRNAAGKLRTLDLVEGGNDGMRAHERLIG